MDLLHLLQNFKYETENLVYEYLKQVLGILGSLEENQY